MSRHHEFIPKAIETYLHEHTLREPPVLAQLRDETAKPDYFERTLTLLRPGGLAAIDNTLWSGKVADAASSDETALLLRHFNDRLHHDERIDLSVLPIGDGLTLARKR